MPINWRRAAWREVGFFAITLLFLLGYILYIQTPVGDMHAAWDDLGFSSTNRVHFHFSRSMDRWYFSTDNHWLCGFINASGKLMIPATYTLAKPFSEGLAAVALEKQWGYINRQGNVVIEFNFDDAENFYDNLAAVRVGQKWGYIKKDGTFAIAPRFLDAYCFSQGLALVQLDSEVWAYVDPTGKIAFRLPDSADAYECRPFAEGFALIKGRKNSLHFVNTNGQKVFQEFSYTTSSFRNGFASVGFPTNTYPYNKQGFINTAGQVAIQPLYAAAGSFHENLASVFSSSTHESLYPEGKYGFINSLGTLVIPFKFDDVGDFHEGLAQVLVGKNWGFVNSEGNLQIAPRFDETDQFSEGVARVRSGWTWRYVNQFGYPVIDPHATLCGRFHDGLALVAFRRPPFPFHTRTEVQRLHSDMGGWER